MYVRVHAPCRTLWLPVLARAGRGEADGSRQSEKKAEMDTLCRRGDKEGFAMGGAGEKKGRRGRNKTCTTRPAALCARRGQWQWEEAAKGNGKTSCKAKRRSMKVVWQQEDRSEGFERAQE